MESLYRLLPILQKDLEEIPIGASFYDKRKQGILRGLLHNGLETI